MIITTIMVMMNIIRLFIHFLISSSRIVPKNKEDDKYLFLVYTLEEWDIMTREKIDISR